MTIKEALKRFFQIEIELLLSHILGQPKEFLFMTPQYKLSSYQAIKLSRLVERRLQGEPLAYILGYKDFCGLRFKVNRSVLIPRPETEWLVNCVILNIAKRGKESQKKSFTKVQDDKRKIKILDMGTGSGCIIISLAHELKAKSYKLKADLYASDISKKALDIAKINAKGYHVGIKFIQSDLFAKIKGKFDIIIVNLPYVSLSDYKKLKKNLKFEPKIALSGGKNTWELYQKFFEQLPCHIRQGSVVLLECDPKSRLYLTKWVKKNLSKTGFKFYKDFNNLWRYLEILF